MKISRSLTKNTYIRIFSIITAALIIIVLIVIKLIRIQLVTPEIINSDQKSNPSKPSFSIPPSANSLSLITSSYPINSVTSFIFPPPSQDAAIINYDPYQLLAQADKDQNEWLNEEKNKPNVQIIHGQILPAADMNLRPVTANNGDSYVTTWLKTTQPFEAVAEILPIYPTVMGKIQTFAIKAFLDGKELKLAKKGEALSSSISFSLNSGEKALFEIITEPLPIGVHNLGFVEFPFSNDDTSDSNYQANLSNISNSYPYKVFVGTGQSQSNIQWQDWSSGKNPFPNLPDSFVVTDLEKTLTSAGIVRWQPGPLKASQKTDYNIILTNQDDEDREYCLIALLDYEVIPLRSSQSCGIVKAGQIGLITGSFTAPTKPGIHRLEIIQISNPEMKDSYVYNQPKRRMTEYRSSGRILLTIH